MPFKVIDDMDSAVKLYEAGLLWYRVPRDSIHEWKPRIPPWRAPLREYEYKHGRREQYAVLLED